MHRLTGKNLLKLLTAFFLILKIQVPSFSQSKKSIDIHDYRESKVFDFSNDTIYSSYFDDFSLFSISQDTISRSINFSNSVFIDTSDFSNSIFFGIADFSSTKFKKLFTFSKVKFQKKANFSNANFENCCSIFTRSTFYQDADFSETKSSGFTNFSHAKFFGDVNFSNSTYRYLIFDNSIINEDIKFSNAKLDTCSFVYSKIKKNIYFDSSEIHVLNFSYADFNNIDLSFCKFTRHSRLFLIGISLSDSSTLNFFNCSLPDTIDFVFSNKIKNVIYFNNANFEKNKKPHLINLFKSDISKIKIDYINFKLFFPDSLFYADQVNKISIEDKEAIYEALLANFKGNGQLESFKNLDIEYQNFKWENSGAAKLSWLPKVWWNYGYNKDYIFKWTFEFIIFFTILNSFLLKYLNDRVYNMENINYNEIHGNKMANQILNRIWFSFIYTSSIFFKLTLKTEKINWTKKLGSFYIVMIYTIGLICIAYMANFVIQK